MSSRSHLHFGSNEETGDSNELECGLKYVSLSGHETVKVVLSQVIRLSVESVDLTHLEHNGSKELS